MKLRLLFASILAGALLLSSAIADAAPARAKVGRCAIIALDDATGSGVGHSPATRKVNIEFAYTTRAAADDTQKAAVATATTRVELCIVDGTGAATCNAGTNSAWLLFDSTSKPGGIAPTAANILDAGAGGPPPGINLLSFEVPGADYAAVANKGKFVILKVNGETSDDARNLGGTCPLPYLVSSSAHFEIYGTEDSVADPWAGKGFGAPCTGAKIQYGTGCVPLAGLQNLLTDHEGSIGWQTGRFGSPANLESWRNGDSQTVCGGVCKGHIWVFPIPWLGFNQGPGRISITPDFGVSLINWYAGAPLTTITHELFHALQSRYLAPKHVGFVEGTAEAMERNICIQNLTQLPNRCVSSGQLGANIESVGGGLTHPGNNVLSFPYESGLYWRYFMEQYALPLSVGGFARPAGGQASTLPSNPALPLGDPARNADEGSDLLRLVMEELVEAVAAGTAEPPLLQLTDSIVATRLQRNLDNMLLDFHTAALVKDYRGAPPEWRFDWVGDYNAGAAAPIHAAAPAPAQPIETLKPFALPSSSRLDELPRALRVVDRRNVGPADTVANGTEEVINAYGAAYLSVVPTAPGSIVNVRLRPAHHGAPRFRVLTVDSAGAVTLVPQCAQEVGTGAARVRQCGGDADGNVSVDVSTGSGATAVSEILVVASAASQPVSFFYQIGAAAPIVEIEAPSSGQPVLAGTPNPNGTARPFLAQFVVRDGAGKSVPGLTTSQLRFSMLSGGTTTTITDVRLLPLSGGVYFARATLPVAALPIVASNIGFMVEYLDQAGTTVLASATQAGALQVTGTPPVVATQLLIDLSDSMNEDSQKKLNAVKEAANFLLDTIPNGDEVGIITYNHDANTFSALAPLDDARRTTLQADVQGMTAAGCTSLGDPMLEAQSNFNARFTSGTPILNMLMLSDGINTAHYTPSFYYAPDAPGLPVQHDGDGTTTCGLGDPNPNDSGAWLAGSLKWSDQTRKPRVTTIAFGQNADLIELSNAANATKGVFVYADEGGVGQVGTGAHELADAYRQGYNLASQQTRIGTARVDTTADLPNFVVEQNAQRLQVSLFSRTVPPSSSLFLVSPSGVQHAAVRIHDKTAVYRVTAPEAGTWHWFIFTPDPDEPPVVSVAFLAAAEPPPVFVEAAVSSTMVLLGAANVENAVTGRFLTDDEQWVGKDVFIRAIPTDGGDILNASVFATVRDPAGLTVSTTLFDDGQHGDGGANDGVYGVVLRDARAAGTYAVRLFASGVSARVGAFERETSLAFNLHGAPDSDGDGVPDFRDPNPAVPDADDDPDHDGVTNGGEFTAGTNPSNPDTDGGGETDGSEIGGGTDPRNPADDRIRPYTIHVSACAGKVLITPEIPVPNFVEIEASSQGPLGAYTPVYFGPAATPLSIPAPGSGGQQCYRMRTIAGTIVSAWSSPFCLTTDTAKADPHPPVVQLHLANGTSWARSRRAEVDVLASDKGDQTSRLPRCTEAVESGVTQMQVSFSADFAGAVWQPFTRRLNVNLPPTGNVFTIWVKVRDAAGNESEPALVTLRLAKPLVTDFLVYGKTGGARLEDGVTLVGGDAGPGNIASEATTIQTEIGAQASTGDVFSKSSVFLRAAGKIDGAVATAKTLSKQTGAIVLGTVVENTPVTLPGLPAFTIQPGTGAAVTLEPNQTRTLAPGNYGNVTLKSGSKLTLASGTYRFKAAQIEPGAQVILKKSTGPTRLHMSSLVHRGKVVESGGFFGQTLFAVSGTTAIFIEGPFIGTLLAPSADTTIGTGVAAQHTGAFQARSVLVRSRATLYHLPWDYASP